MDKKLCTCAFGLAGGILWGLAIFVLTLISVWTGYANDLLTMVMGIYLGYEITILGAFIGLIYGFIDGFIGFAIFAWFYNLLCKHCKCRICKK
jgi:hypothetical protein